MPVAGRRFAAGVALRPLFPLTAFDALFLCFPHIVALDSRELAVVEREEEEGVGRAGILRGWQDGGRRKEERKREVGRDRVWVGGGERKRRENGWDGG